MSEDIAGRRKPGSGDVRKDFSSIGNGFADPFVLPQYFGEVLLYLGSVRPPKSCRSACDAIDTRGPFGLKAASSVPSGFSRASTREPSPVCGSSGDSAAST